MGSKKPTQTTTESSASPSYVTGAQQNFLGSVMPALAPQLTGGGIAPFNQDQESAFGQIRGAVGQPINQNVYSFTPAQAAAMQAAVAQGAQLDPNAYKPFLNPYTSEVVDRTTANMQRQHENDLNAIRARAAAGNSFADSGARAALKESTATDNYNRAVGDVTAQLMAQGYDKATATAMANTQLQQQTNLANAGFQQQANQANAGFQQQANLYNAQGANETAARNVDYADNIARQRIQDLLGIGNTQQALAQQGYNRPLQVAQVLGGLIPQDRSAMVTKTAPSTSPSTLQTILGLTGTIGGSVLGGPVGAGIGSALGTGIGSLFDPYSAWTRGTGLY
jgi:hypothetical protein